MDINERVISEALYIAENGCTLRQCARIFGVGKSTVHTDMTVRLPAIDEKIAIRVAEILHFNSSVKHIRGGDSTRRKYVAETIRPLCPTDCTPPET